jgi:hypothetical protein
VASLVLTTAAAAQSPTLTVTLQSNVPRVRSTGLLADGKFVDRVAPSALGLSAPLPGGAPA